MKYNQIELLAPAGSYEGFLAAVGAGADAVYVGGTAFGARAYARNFQKEELLRAIDMSHIHGKKLYLTVNTLLKNRELESRLYDYVAPYYEAGLDAVIVQDMGVFRFLREQFPDLHLHASTQMAVTGPEGMKFLEEKGASRVVAARELSLEELARMHKASGIEIEAFVHGALCYSFSGQCLMSSLIGGRSGNRGRCAQPCRLPYSTALPGKGFKGSKDLCALSLKDICTVDILPEILEAGVTSLKIEGRMKQPGYTAGVTSVYRKYLDLYLEKGGENYQVEENDRRYLLELFNRGGSCSGYYKMQRGPSMMAFTNEKKTGDVLAEITKTKEKIYGNLILFPGSPAILEVSLRGCSAQAWGAEVQYARSQPMEEGRIRKQMEKLGDTPFQWERLDIQMDGNIFIPVKTLNEMRRDALASLEEQLLKPFRREPVRCTETAGTADVRQPDDRAGKKDGKNSDKRDNKEGLPLYVSCEQKDTALALCEAEGIEGLYLTFEAMEKCFAKGITSGKELYLTLPYVTRGDMPDRFLSQAEMWLERGMKGFLVRNLESYAMLRERGLQSKCVIDHSLYTWNDQAVRFWREEGILKNTVPLELNEGEIAHRDNRGSELLVYGYLPLMLSAQCVRKNLYGCNAGQERLRIQDRLGKEFPVECQCRPWKMVNTENQEYCYNIIYNSIPYGLLKEKQQVEALGTESLRLSFTIETTEEALGILKDFQKVYQKGEKPGNREFTKGHFKRGAE
ncbi:MAG: DUF3656 domain-containing protein [Eubacteriales bacterium]|nr:DUF3656 domain-containing protein [Eubacteriales bacterium]